MRRGVYIAKKSLQIIVDFLQCENLKFLNDLKFAKKEIDKILKENKITKIKDIGYTFPNFKGFTYLAILKESHIACHTWPEKKLVNFDIFLCNFRYDNREKVLNLVKSLEKFLLPQIKKIKKIERIT